MVMEEGPSPQSVGREFVRQYYTLLNKFPLHLHRFYNNDSSFTHGGLGAKGQEVFPVFGQQDIHRKIVELDFRDCKAKILSVDAQHTLGNGVVVQVSGELSNNGQPMRRFMQTFVLAPQSAKKYYVRNDVFRYQDEVFSDDDEGTDVDHVDTELEVKQPAQPSPTYAENIETPAIVNPEHSTPTVNGPSQLQEDIRSIPTTTAPFTSINGMPATTESATASPQFEETLLPTVTKTSPQIESSLPPSDIVEPEKKTESPPAVAATNAKNVELNTTPAVVSNEPKTYANLLKTGAFSGATPGIPSAAPPATATRNTSSTPPAPVTEALTSTQPGTGESNLSFQGGQQQRYPRPGKPMGYGTSRPAATFRGERERNDRDRDERAESRNSGEENEWRPHNGGEGFKERDMRRYDDSQAVFVGNIPHSATEDNIRDLFEQFGKVVDVRIQSKPGTKTANGARAPNFGFVTFESPASAEAALSKKPVLLYGEHRLNVEPKRRGGGQSSSGFRGNDQRGQMNRPGGIGGPTRGGRMGGGMPGGPPRDGGRVGIGGGPGGRGGFSNRRQ